MKFNSAFGTKSLPKKRHELVVHSDGTKTLRETVGGQSMHSWIGPWAEANLLYVEQSGFEKLCLEPAQSCTIFDVGLGLAANALAAIEKYRAQGCRGKLRIVSFENDLDGIRSALELREQFDFLGPYTEILERLIEDKEITDGNVEWSLLEGDFRETLGDAPPADIVFWDFYDPKTCPHLWSVEVFKQLRAHCAKSEASGRPTRLYTYSASTPTRIGLCLGGFYIGYGKRTPVKVETTAAATDVALLERPMTAEWLEKLKRSNKTIPYGAAEGTSPESIFQEIIRQPQFA